MNERHASTGVPLELCERLAHPVEMRVLASAHAFVFRALQGLLVDRPRFEYRQSFGDREVMRGDDVHRTAKTRRLG
jgi:hypothetical protein